MPPNSQQGVTVVLPRLLPGLNGPDGLIRQSKFIGSNKKMKDSIQWQIRQSNLLEKVRTPCRAVLVRYQKGNIMDWDNAVASFKYMLDAIVKCGVIPDDNPKVIISITCEQHPVKDKSEERMEVTFYPIHELIDDSVVFL
jgi:ribosomal protein S20